MNRILMVACAALALALSGVVSPNSGLAQSITITPPADITTTTDPGLCTAVVPYTFDVTGGTPPLTITSDPPSGSAFPTGNTTVTITAADAVGDSATASFTVTVNDTEHPAITAPADMTFFTGPGSTTPSVMVSDLGSASATDNCPDVTTQGPALPASFPLGTTIVTYTATDTSDNTSSANQAVTVVDNTPPVITVPGTITVHAPDASGIAVTFAATATDNSGIAVSSVDCAPASGSLFPAGSTLVTCTAADAFGNTASASFTVVVINDAAVGAINALSAQVTALNLHAGTSSSLLSKLDATLAAISASDLNGACGSLGAFINAVEAQSGKKIMATDAPALIDAANLIRTQLGCP